MEYLETIVVPLSGLVRFPGNSRKHADKRLDESTRLGQYKSLLVRRLADGSHVIVAGNGTADSLERVGAVEARVEVWDYTDAEARRVNVADNRLSDLASDDEDAQAALLASMGGDYEGSGFSVQEADKLLGTEPMPDPGDAAVDDDPGNRWGLIVECGTEEEQVRLLRELGEEGLNVRAIMS